MNRLLIGAFRATVFASLAFLLVVSLPAPVAQAAPIDEGPRASGPIALSDKGKTLVNVNPEANSISVFEIKRGVLAKKREIAVGHDPVSLALHPKMKRAFVANALDGTIAIVEYTNRNGYKQTLTAGAEPSAVAISPNGTRLYVANSASNDLWIYDSKKSKPTRIAVVDLSSYGTAPRAIAVTNDGDKDDTDETVFVALFFGQLRAGKTSLEEGQDDQREGRVVAISASTNTVLGTPNPIALAPVAVTGFNSNGRLVPAPSQVPAVAQTNPQTFTTATGAFPNQLAAIALHPTQSLAYVVSTGASPNGPFRFNSNSQGLVSVFDAVSRQEVTAAQTDPTVRRTAPLNLNQGINLDTAAAPRLFLSNPVAIAWRPDGSDAWIAVQNSDVIVRMTVDSSGVPTIGAPLVAGPGSIVRVDLQATSAGQLAGKAPRGIAIDEDGDRAYVYNFVSRSISVLDISSATAPQIVATVQASALPAAGTPEATVHLGEELFFSGRGPQGRMSSESWGGCIACHPSGRSDNVTWMFDTGPRQTIALDGIFSKSDPADKRSLNWSAVRDENQDFELNTRNVFGGRGLIDDDRLFLAIGGASGATPLDSALLEQFHQVTGVVGTTNDLDPAGAALPALVGSRRDFAVATLGDDRVFILGGRTGAGAGTLVDGTSAVLELNPRTNVLTARSAAGFTLRHSLGAAAVQTSLGPRVYAIGGCASTDGATLPITTVEEYDPGTDSWRTVASLPTAVAQFGIAVAGGINTVEPLQLVHVVSGNTGSETVPSVVNANPVQRFQADPAGTGTWSTFAAAGLTLRRNHGAAAAIRGVGSRVYVIGGQDATGTVLATVEEYLAQAVTFVATPHTALPSPRARFGIAGSLSTNQIYVIGGVDDGGADQTTIFEYSIATNGAVAGPPGTPSGAWVTRGNLSAARRGLGVSNPPGVTNLLPVANVGRDARQDAIEAWVATIRASRAPVAAADAAAVRGRALFGQDGLVVQGFSCVSCHGGAKWTRSEVDYAAPPSPETGLGFGNERVIGAELRQTQAQGTAVLANVGTFTLGAGRTNEVRFNGADISQAVNPLGANGFNIPSLLSCHETAPYFYSGLAQTLAEVLDGSQDGNGGTQHHFVTDPAQRSDLIRFLSSIDQNTASFP